MAQHDYVIANGTGAAVRSDLNNALAAIVTQNSGATAPATTYAYQWWADTTTGLLKIRNAANNAWITLFQLDGEWSTLAVENGSAAAPSIYFKDSGTDTGIYSPGTDQVAISTSGAGRLFVDSSGRVGVGTSSPGDKLEVNGNGLFYGNTGSQNGIFVGSNSSFNWSIQRENVSTGRLDFAVTAGGSPSTKMTLDTSGRLGIGTTTPSHRLNVVQTTGGTMANFTNNADADFQIGCTSGVTTIGPDVGVLALKSSSAERARIDSSGRLLVGTSSAYSLPCQFMVQGYDGNSTNVPAIMQLVRSDTDIVSGDELGQIRFSGSESGTGGQGVFITGEADGTWTGSSFPGRLKFSTTSDGASSPTERMRIGSDGILYLGATSTVSTIVNARLQVRGSNAATFQGDSGTAGQQVVYIHHTNTSGNNLFLEFGTEASITTRGSVDYNRAAGQVRYNVTSDRRLKSDIQPASTALDAISAIQVRSYKWAETGYQVDHGFIAQELNEVAPDAVKVGDDGEEVTDTWAVDNGKLVPLLTKALQEAIAKIETLEARLTAAGIA